MTNNQEIFDKKITIMFFQTLIKIGNLTRNNEIIKFELTDIHNNFYQFMYDTYENKFYYLITETNNFGITNKIVFNPKLSEMAQFIQIFDKNILFDVLNNFLINSDANI